MELNRIGDSEHDATAATKVFLAATQFENQENGSGNNSSQQSAPHLTWYILGRGPLLQITDTKVSR